MDFNNIHHRFITEKLSQNVSQAGKLQQDLLNDLKQMSVKLKWFFFPCSNHQKCAVWQLLLMLLDMRVVSVSSHTFSGSFSQVSNSLLTKKVLYIVPYCIHNDSGLRFTFTLWEETYNKVFFLVCRLNSRSDWCWATCEQVLQVSAPTCTRVSHTQTRLPPCGNSSPRKGSLPAG